LPIEPPRPGQAGDLARARRQVSRHSRDYSGCEVADLTAASGGTLPLGLHLFVDANGAVDAGPELFLTPNRHTGSLRKHQGTLICANKVLNIEYSALQKALPPLLCRSPRKDWPPTVGTAAASG
jgi:hypothetical protein